MTLPPTIHSHKMIFNISLGSGNITSHETHTIKWLRQNISDTKISHPRSWSLLCSLLAGLLRVIISDHWGNLHSLHFTEDKCHPSVATDPWKMSGVWFCPRHKKLLLPKLSSNKGFSQPAKHKQPLPICLQPLLICKKEATIDLEQNGTT